jgi:hypothetical protein
MGAAASREVVDFDPSTAAWLLTAAQDAGRTITPSGLLKSAEYDVEDEQHNVLGRLFCFMHLSKGYFFRIFVDLCLFSSFHSHQI